MKMLPFELSWFKMCSCFNHELTSFQYISHKQDFLFDVILLLKHIYLDLRIFTHLHMK